MMYRTLIGILLAALVLAWSVSDGDASMEPKAGNASVDLRQLDCEPSVFQSPFASACTSGMNTIQGKEELPSDSGSHHVGQADQRATPPKPLSGVALELAAPAQAWRTVENYYKCLNEKPTRTDCDAEIEELTGSTKAMKFRADQGYADAMYDLARLIRLATSSDDPLSRRLLTVLDGNRPYTAKSDWLVLARDYTQRAAAAGVVEALNHQQKLESARLEFDSRLNSQQN